jgi:hypothetical protein
VLIYNGEIRGGIKWRHVGSWTGMAPGEGYPFEHSVTFPSRLFTLSIDYMLHLNVDWLSRVLVALVSLNKSSFYLRFFPQLKLGMFWQA